jgi:O-antigen/teichoic acid export membrane protein
MNALLSLFMIMAVPVATLLMVVTKKTAEYKAQNDLAGIKNLFTKANYRVLFTGLLGLAIFLTLAPLIRDYLHAPATAPVLLLGISIFIALAFPINSAVLQGIQDYKWLAITQSLAGPAKLFFCVLFVLTGFSVNGVMGGLVVSGLLLWFLSYIPIRKFIHTIHVDATVRDHIAYSQVFPVFLANLALPF